MICTADAYAGDKAGLARWVEHQAGMINLELEQRGISGAHLIEARLSETESGWQLVIVAGPGQAPLTREKISAWLKQHPEGLTREEKAA